MSPKPEIKLGDILDLHALQSMMDQFHALTGFGMSIRDLEGTTLVSAGGQEICTKFHRTHPESCKHCEESETVLCSDVPPGTFKRFHCKNNLWDMVTPIVVGDQQMGNLFMGQFLFDDEPVNIDTFRAQAQRYAFDESAYLKALERVPRWNRQKVDQAMSFYAQLAQQISEQGFRNLQLARALEEQKKIEGALRASENRYRGLIDFAVDGILLGSAEGFITDANECLCTMAGRTRSEIIGRHVRDLLAPETVKTAPLRFDLLMKGQIVVRERKIIRPDGSEVPVEMHSKMMADGTYQSIFHDIAERKKAEEALQESEQLYHSILNASPDDITITDMAGQILIVSPSSVRMFGYETENQMVGRLVLDFIIPEERERAAGDMARLHRGFTCDPIGYRGEYKGMRADGQTFDIEVNGEFIRNAKGQPTRMILLVRDVSARKQAESHLHLQARLLDAVQESVVSTNLKGHIQYWGQGAQRLFGYSAQEVMGQPYRAYAGSIEPTDEEEFRKQILSHGFWHGEHIQKNRNGDPFWTSSFISLVKDANGQPAGFIGIDQDITSRKKAEEQMAQQLDELQRWKAITLGREGRIAELKREVNALATRLSLPPPYASVVEK